MTKHTIYCPECDGENVSITRKQSVEEKRVSIDELPLDRGPTLVPGVRTINHYIAVCQDCGYHREYDDGVGAAIGQDQSITIDANDLIGGCSSPNMKLTAGIPLTAQGTVQDAADPE